MTTYADNWIHSVNLIQGRIKRLKAHIRAIENDGKVSGSETIRTIQAEIAREQHLLNQFHTAKAQKVKDGSFTSELGSS